MIGVMIIGLTDAMLAIDRVRGEAGTKTEQSVREVAEWGQKAVQRLAPRRTGHYASTIGLFDQSRGDTYSWVIGTSEPYGARLELGFFGADRLGRQYAQAPRPHFGPVADVLPGMMFTHVSQVFS